MALVDTSDKPESCSEPLKRLGSEARGSQPGSKRPELVSAAPLGSVTQNNRNPFVEPCNPQAKAQVQEAEGKVLSSAGKLARVSQPKSKANSGSKSSSDKQTSQPKSKGSKQAPPGTQSVLHFFKAKP